MKFILIFGPPAVGKMSVGRELEKSTGLKLFHNHMAIEIVLPFFDWSTPSFNYLVPLFRYEIFKEVAKSNLPGLIFTYVWEFDQKSEEEYIDSITKIFKDAEAEIYYVELEADLAERLKRCRTAERLEHKPSRRDLECSEADILIAEKNHIMNTKKGEFHRKNYLKINNTKLSVKETAEIIKKEFNL